MALALALAVDMQEQVGEGCAVQRAAGSPHQPRHRIGDIGQPPLGVGRPEPALPALFVIAEQQQRVVGVQIGRGLRSEEHTSELQSLMRISYAVFCLKKKKSQSNINKSRTRNETKTQLTTHTHRANNTKRNINECKD